MIKQIATGTILASTILFTGSTSAEFNLQGLNDQVQRHEATIEQHQTVLDNHEVRIIKLEENKPVNNEPTNNNPTPVEQLTSPEAVDPTTASPSTPESKKDEPINTTSITN